MYCVQRTNIQNLKAIHNVALSRESEFLIVFKERIYKIWKQFTTLSFIGQMMSILCSKNEYTKSESNSQPVEDVALTDEIVFKERIYKIWKQFTTHPQFEYTSAILCSKNEYTKSESNSQLRMRTYLLRNDCVQRTNIQNLKAIHNSVTIRLLPLPIVFKERIYKIWKQFTT